MGDSGPPLHLTAEELVQHFATRPAPEKIVDLPEVLHLVGEPYRQIRIVIPPDSAAAAARVSAIAHIRNQLKREYKDKKDISADDLEPKVVQDLIGDRCAKEMLAKVLFSPHDYGVNESTGQPIRKRIFTGADHIEQSLHSEEIDILYNVFLEVRSELGPRPFVLTQDPELLRQWIDRLKEGAWSLGPLAWLALADLRELCLSALHRIDTFERLGLPLLSNTFMQSLAGGESTLEISDLDNTFSGEPAENSVPSTTNESPLGIPSGETISPERALELARQLRAKE